MKPAVILALLLCLDSNAATIYLCKAYNGSTFWTNGTCSSRNAFIERIESVADVPFDQQVEQARGNTTRNGNKQAATTNQNQYCGQLINEIESIESRYSKGYWQPVETVNRDQKRTIAIRSELQANNCRLQ
jgi:hypothetical protein